jgi:hypothetical protein
MDIGQGEGNVPSLPQFRHCHGLKHHAEMSAGAKHESQINFTKTK